MNFIRNISTLILRHRRNSCLVILSVLALILIIRNKDNSSLPPHLFADSIAYCNSPTRRDFMDNSTYDGYLLLQVQVLIRHGDRAPIELSAIPNTEHVRIPCAFNQTSTTHQGELRKMKDVASKNIFQTKGGKERFLVEERMECVGGQLTPHGYLQHLYFGDLFKKTYLDFLRRVDLEEDVYIQATDVPRTIMSGAAFLTGAFYDEIMRVSPSMKINVFRDRILHGHMMMDENYDYLECPVLSEENKNLRRSPAVRTFFASIEPMMKKFASILLVPRNSLPTFNHLVDCLFAKLCHGQGIPMGPHARLPHSLVKQALQFSHLYFKTFHSASAELRSLSLLSQVALHSLDVLRKNPWRKKVVLYAGHDTMVTPFLHILGIPDEIWPPYAANIILEFYERKLEGSDESVKTRIMSTYFRVLYNGVLMRDIKFCKNTVENGDLCSLGDLFDYVSSGVYDNSVGMLDESAFNELLFNRIKSLCQHQE